MPRPIRGKNPGPMAASVMVLPPGELLGRYPMGNEGCAVVGHQPDGLADAQARGLVADDPRPQRGAETVELGQRVEQLVDVPLLAVDAAGRDLAARRHDRDVGALAAEAGLADVLGE